MTADSFLGEKKVKDYRLQHLKAKNAQKIKNQKKENKELEQKLISKNQVCS